jgi:RND superfamily putative drug exporter
VPLKAALLNLLSIGAAYGVVVAIFQWGWARGLVGLATTVPIMSFVPMLMFAILFGLSMDYEVFLLSRIREEYVATGDAHGSVVTAIAATARVITSAALIMVCVFVGFVFSPDPVLKMVGVGLAVAVAIDATIVRVVLVPALMSLLGDRAWWLPRWLDRILPSVNLEATTPAPTTGTAHTHPGHAASSPTGTGTGTVASGPQVPPASSRVEPLPVQTAIRNAQSDQSWASPMAFRSCGGGRRCQ